MENMCSKDRAQLIFAAEIRSTKEILMRLHTFIHKAFILLVIVSILQSHCLSYWSLHNEL